MGESEGKSMLYLEARCLSLVRAAGSQGVQNGSISCIALALAVPGGTREVLAENVLAAWLDLEVASGNDAIASHSEIRKTGKLMGQFLPGTDFVTSGYSSMPRYDNMFGGGNYDSDDLDEWLTLQRDWQVDAGIEPLGEEECARGARAGGARGAGGVRRARLPGDHGRGGAPGGDVPRLARPAGPRPRRGRVGRRPRADGADQRARRRARACERGFDDVAEAVFGMQRQKVAADYLQTSAIIDADGTVVSAVNDPNALRGPGHGLSPRGRALAASAAAPVHDRRAAARLGAGRGAARSRRRAKRVRGTRADEVVIAVGPAVGDALSETINGLQHRDVLAALVEGVRDEGAEPRLVRVRRSSDVAFIGHDGARLSGSGIAVGLQSKGTALIHRADLEPLDNLELFGMAPSLTLDSYRQIGRNAAGYALGRPVAPVPTVMDNYARAKLIVRTTLLHARETAAMSRGGAPVELVLAEIPAAVPSGR